MDRLPDAFIVVDPQGVIRRANQAFLNLVQVTTEASVIGERLGRWLSQPGAAAGVLFAQLQQHGSVRLFATSMTGDLGAEADVEISASGLAEGGSQFMALVIRDVSRRLPMHDVQDQLRAALGAVAERIGKTPLPIMVRDTAEVVERHCIEIALRLAKGRRTAAAELLGLSRQSLYAKLERYDIGDAPEGGAGRSIAWTRGPRRRRCLRRPSGRRISPTASGSRSTSPPRSSRMVRCWWCASRIWRWCRPAPMPATCSACRAAGGTAAG